MGLIHDITVAANSKRPFREAFKIARCVRLGHDRTASALVEKLRSEKHQASNAEFVFTINIMRCPCGLTYLDSGLEFRVKP